jgi:hypothetical protein
VARLELRLLRSGEGFASALNGNQRLLHDERRIEMQDAM